MKQYVNRRHAGELLAKELQQYHGQQGLVLGLPRGGLPVAAEVARNLQAPLDIVVVRKIGVPAQPEVAMGALAAIAGKVQTIHNPMVLDMLGPPSKVDAMFAQVAAAELVELKRREKLYRAGRPALTLAGRPVFLVDDGLATGATMRAAVAAVRSQNPARIIVAVPVASRDTCREVGALVDELVCLWTPRQFRSVGQAYQNFEQTTDGEVREILAAAQQGERQQDRK